MLDIGVEPFLISSVVIASVAQRLVRCVCPDCAEDYQPDRQELRSIGASPEEAAGARFRKGAGCEACRYTGYRGRVAIYEILPFTNAVKELTNRQAAASEIKRRALEQGMRTLRQAGWSQVKRGRTTIEEVLRVTADSDSSDELDAVATTNDAQVPV
jgi:type II secretory ATPase GspE/PulE/Tfp pilus assembly ATPase PilB-like protein